MSCIVLVLDRPRHRLGAEQIINPGRHDAKRRRRHLVRAAADAEVRAVRSVVQHSLERERR